MRWDSWSIHTTALKIKPENKEYQMTKSGMQSASSHALSELELTEEHSYNHHQPVGYRPPKGAEGSSAGS